MGSGAIMPEVRKLPPGVMQGIPARILRQDAVAGKHLWNVFSHLAARDELCGSVVLRAPYHVAGLEGRSVG